MCLNWGYLEPPSQLGCSQAQLQPCGMAESALSLEALRTMSTSQPEFGSPRGHLDAGPRARIIYVKTRERSACQDAHVSRQQHGYKKPHDHFPTGDSTTNAKVILKPPAVPTAGCRQQ